MEQDYFQLLTDENNKDINGLIESLKSINNPFLFQEAKKLLLDIKQKDRWSITIPEYFPENIKVKIKLLLSKLSYAKQKQLQSMMEHLRDNLLKLPLVENQLWPEANYLINLPSIKKLSANLAAKILDFLPSITQTKKLEALIRDRFEDKSIDQQMINNQVQQLEIDGQSIDLNTLISYIIKNRPQQKSVYYRILDNKKNLSVFKNQIFRAFSKTSGHDLCCVVNISKNYVLLPNKNFDPNNYIKNTGSHYGKYKSNISSRNTILEGVKLSRDGKTITISFSQKFQKGNTQECLPYLKISHDIPNQQIFWSQIQNSQAELNVHTRESHILQNNLKEHQQNLKSQKALIKDMKKYLINKKLNQIQQKIKNQQERIKQTDRNLKIENIQKIKKSNMDQKQRQLERVTQEIQNTKQNLSRTKGILSELQIQLKQNIVRLEQMNTYFKQFALLIKDQLSKKVPQSLQKFIKIAFQIGDKDILKPDQNGNMTKVAKLKIENYDKFLKVYQVQKNSLQLKVIKLLTEKY